ncbi:hypothetical protein G6F23_015446 [Rhizopus arrhizus]|nr:hypothetical protein G6F23_015446 [Rhizopus arrhizus]
MCGGSGWWPAASMAPPCRGASAGRSNCRWMPAMRSRQPAGARLCAPRRSVERPPAVALEPAGAAGDQAQQRAGHGHPGPGHQHRHPAVRARCRLVGRPAGTG